MNGSVPLLANGTNFCEASIPAQPVDGSGTFNLVATFDVSQGRIATLTGIVGAAALTGLKVSCAAVQGGRHHDRLVNTDFNQNSHAVLTYAGRSDVARSNTTPKPTNGPFYATLSPSEQTAWNETVTEPNIHSTPGNCTFQIQMDLSGVAELKVWAASSGSGTTLAVEIGATKSN